jgi:hypothetical protein
MNIDSGRSLKNGFPSPLADARDSVGRSESALTFLSRDRKGAVRRILQQPAGVSAFF